MSIEERPLIQTQLAMGGGSATIATALRRNGWIRPKTPCGALRTEVIGWLRFGHAKRRPPCAW